MKHLHENDKALKDKLAACPIRPLTEAELLLIRVVDFDHSYEYSDDIKVYREWKAKEVVLRKDIQESELVNAEVKALALRAIKDAAGDGPLKELRERYPQIDLRFVRPKGVHKLIAAKGEDYTDNVLGCLKALSEMMDQMPPASFVGSFVMTPSTPHAKLMRDHAKAGQYREQFYGCALPKALQDTVNEFFKNSFLKRNDWSLIQEYDLTCCDSGKFGYHLEYVVDKDAPKKYADTVAAYIRVFGNGREYYFYV